MKKRKRIKAWAVIPNNMNMKVIYRESLSDAKLEQEFLKRNGTESLISEMEQFEDIVQSKSMSIARSGYYL